MPTEEDPMSNHPKYGIDDIQRRKLCWGINRIASSCGILVYIIICELLLLFKPEIRGTSAFRECISDDLRGVVGGTVDGFCVAEGWEEDN